MGKWCYVLVTLIMLSGCSQFKVPTGQTEDVLLGKDGKPFKVTTTQIPLGDSQFYHTQTQQIVARAAAAADQTKATSIADITKYTMEHAGTQTEAVLVGVIGGQAIRDVKSSIAPALKAIGKRPTSGYDAFMYGIDKLSAGIPIVFREIEVNKTIRHAQDSAGSSQVTNVSGDGNTVDTVSKTTKVDVRNNIATRGENAGVNIDNNQTAVGCPTGDCSKKDDKGEDVDPGDWECVTNPDCNGNENGSVCIDHQCVEPALPVCEGSRGTVPGHHIAPNGDLWVSPTCSCGSYQDGRCDV